MRICCSLPVALSLADDVDDAVGVDVEGHLDLRHAARRRRDADEIELAEQLVVGRHLAFALEDADRHRGWLSSAVEKTWLFLVGMVVLRSIRRVNTPPRVSMPSDSGVTSSSSTSLTSPCRTPPWIAAPMATTSSGLTPLCGSLPKNCLHRLLTFGMRVMPPTRTTSSISPGWRPASFSAALHGPDGALDQVVDQALELGAGQLDVRCFGPDCVGGDERQVDLGLGSRTTARSWPSPPPPSGAAGPACRPRRSMPCSFLNSSAR